MGFADLNSSDGIQEISATSLPLPTGAATETTLASIDAGIPAALGQTTMAESMPVVIASNQTSIPVEIQSSTSATFSVVARDVTLGTNKSMLSIVNASGSTVKLKLKELYIVNVQNTSVNGIVADFSLFRIVGHSGGTSLTPQSFDTADTLNASITCRTGATVTSEASTIIKHWDFSSDEWTQGAADSESASHDVQVTTNLMPQTPGCKSFTLNANEGFHIKQVATTTVSTFDIVAVFTQENL